MVVLGYTRRYDSWSRTKRMSSLDTASTIRSTMTWKSSAGLPGAPVMVKHYSELMSLAARQMMRMRGAGER
jgi:hypothetical protein